MNIKNHKFFLGWSAFVIIALLATGLIVTRSAARYETQQNALRDAQQRLQNFYNQAPFPSESNISICASNIAMLKNYRKELKTELCLGQPEARAMEPAEFLSLLGAKKTAATELMQKQGVKVPKEPKEFALGFEEYTSGKPPDRTHIPKLVYQLEISENICRLLAQAKITELRLFERDTFETAAQSEKRQPQGPQPPYSKMTFRMIFQANESAALTVLNKIAAASPFMAVRRVKFENPATPTPIDVEKLKTELQHRFTERELRLRTGKEEITAEILLDVYQFAPDETAKGDLAG